jgi:penicillin-insensitive murein DD-endopeptidase
VREDKLDIDPKVWTPGHTAIIKAAAEDPLVERILVNAAIKKALCRDANGDRSWLRKVRPWYWHNYHFHIRIGCPKDSPNCKPQDAAPTTEGCGSELSYWFQPKILRPPEPPSDRPRKYATMNDLPAECRQVLVAP